MLTCINCGRPRVRQTDDGFICEHCGHEWTAETERQMAGYIKTVLRRDPQTGDTQVAEPEGDQKLDDEVIVVNLAEMTKDELLAYAEEYGIDLTGVRSKTNAEIIERIYEVLSEREAANLDPEDDPETNPDADEE